VLLTYPEEKGILQDKIQYESKKNPGDFILEQKNPGDFILEQKNLTYAVVGGIARRNSTCNFRSKARIKDQTKCTYKTKLGTKICRFPHAPLA
jgi:hypothetical protein